MYREQESQITRLNARKSLMSADSVAVSVFRSGSLHASAGVQVNHLWTRNSGLSEARHESKRAFPHLGITCDHISKYQLGTDSMSGFVEGNADTKQMDCALKRLGLTFAFWQNYFPTYLKWKSFFIFTNTKQMWSRFVERKWRHGRKMHRLSGEAVKTQKHKTTKDVSQH